MRKLLSYPFHLLDLCPNDQIHGFANKPEAYAKGELLSKMQSTGLKSSVLEHLPVSVWPEI